MQHSIQLSLSLASTVALALASIPFGAARADDTKVAQAPATAKDLGEMDINLKDVVKLNYGFQGALQGAGTPNQAGLGAFIPIKVSKNSVSFVDVLVNANFNDYGNYSSIVKTTVAGTTFSTSTRLGYRWLNSNRSWMYGINAGYDSRPMATGPTDNGVPVTNSQTVFFQQVAAGIEAVSNTWNFNAYALVPVGEVNTTLNSSYGGGSLYTYGLDAGYSITPQLNVALGSYYQLGDCGCVSDFGVRGRIAYYLTNGVTIGGNLSYDPSFDTRVSADIKYRFGANGYGAPSIRKQKPDVRPVIQTLSTMPANRDVHGTSKNKMPITERTSDLMSENQALSTTPVNRDAHVTSKDKKPITELTSDLMPVIQALSATPANRDVRVHDGIYMDKQDKKNSSDNANNADHKHWIDILSLSWGAGRSINTTVK